MDGREAMASYHLYRGLSGGSQPSPPWPTAHGGRPVAVPNPNPNPSLQVHQSSSIGGGGGSVGSGFQVESPPSISPRGPPNVGGDGLGGDGGLEVQVEPVKRKRGRPRKYAPEGRVSLGLSPMSALSPPGQSGSGKRGRGRPPGTGRKQQLASLGEWVMGSAGMAFTPHVITISVGEDIAAKIMSFSQQGPRAVCILSANGSVSTVTLRQPGTSTATVTYEGRFEVLSLSGSYYMTDDGGSRSRTGALSISLASPDGRVIGGGVGGLLIAASNVQVIVGSFIYSGYKQKSKEIAAEEHGLDSEIGEEPSNTSGGAPVQIPSPPATGGWPAPRQIDMRNSHMDIDLTRG